MSCAVSGVVVAYGDEELLARSLGALDAALRRVDGETELIVVLNRKIDQERCPLADGWIAVEPGRNVGFAGGVAAGLARARGTWVVVVNDDCVVEEDTVAALLAATSEDARIGAVATRVLFAGGAVVNSTGLEIDRLGVASERLVGAPAPAADGAPRDVFGASGAAALYRRAMFEDVGGFDESFFAYLEDADLAWRARMRGWKTVYAPDAVVHHRHSSALRHASPAKDYLVGRNRVRMLAKNATRSQLLRHGPAIVLYDLVSVLYAAATRHNLGALRGRVAGLREWRTYRAAGRRDRRAVPLAAPQGIRGALRRDQAYRGQRDESAVADAFVRS